MDGCLLLKYILYERYLHPCCATTVSRMCYLRDGKPHNHANPQPQPRWRCFEVVNPCMIGSTDSNSLKAVRCVMILSRQRKPRRMNKFTTAHLATSAELVTTLTLYRLHASPFAPVARGPCRGPYS